MFTLRGVDPIEMLEAAIDQPTAAGKARGEEPETDSVQSDQEEDREYGGNQAATKKKAGKKLSKRKPVARKATNKAKG